MYKVSLKNTESRAVFNIIEINKDIVHIAFNTLIPVSFSLFEATQKFLF